ncbi:MAG TPA: serine/threonine-protein kinase [Candidatus Acidoferrum sp.]|nr:serine/threonine-protein kinase [Candidatus Acidoferrum sp.]
MTQDIIGSRKGDYEILALLGVGGMGQVYKVRNVLSDRVEAMKVLLPNLADQKGLADRFIREIKVLAGIHHPNIAELRTALTIDNQLVMIMEFVEGSTLAARVQQGAIPYGQALGYIQQVLAALSYAHSQKIIHRDIKPANMMLTPTGVVKLMDFGIARQDGDVGLTVTNSTVGSIAYMSPEQVKGEPADARSDLYSVGVSLYEMVTGQRPFQGDTGFSIMQAHLQTMPKPPIELRPDLPATLSDLIMMAVAKEPAKRFQSADAFSRAIGSVMPVIEGTAPMIPATPSSPASASQPTMVAPPPIAETSVGGSASSGSPFQATQFASAPGSLTPSHSPTMRPAPAAAAKSPSQPMPPAPQNSYRGFYIALGALMVLVVLVAAGFYVPRHLKTQAAQQSSSSASDSAATPASSATPDPSAAAQPAAAATPDSSSGTPPSSTTVAPPASAASAVSSAPAPAADASTAHINIPPRAATSASTGAASDTTSPHINIPPRAGSATSSNAAENSAPHVNIPPRGSTSQPSANSAPTSGAAAASADSNQSSGSTGAKPAPADAAALQQAETETDQLSSRGGAITTSLDNLKKAQSAQGLGLRGDMVAAEQRMQNNLAKAQSAVAAGDAAQAKHYLDLAEPDVEKLEKFLGH